MGGGNTLNCICHGLYNEIISLNNLFAAWYEFKRGKIKKQDVQKLSFNLEDNIFNLHQELKNKTYQHSRYESFYIQDPKLRHIHKACVKDRVVHQALFRILYHLFDRKFIYDSYSCRLNKGTHKGVLRLEKFSCKVSKNHTKTAYALKCDIKKFFENINHSILLGLIEKTINDSDTLWLINKIIKSFKSRFNQGLPLGNVTSQLFANIYLNELDQFMKHKLKEKYYLRYCDDFVILSNDKKYLLNIIKPISEFLSAKLNLNLHQDKIIIRKLNQGVDFLGYVVLPHYKLLRTKTKKRIYRKLKLSKEQYKDDLITRELFYQILQSYLGMLKHCRGHKIKKKLL